MTDGNFDVPVTGTPVILYELNEVSWQVVDWYIGRNPHGNFANILGMSRSYTTVTTDVGELHPWVTWPTLHRGVDNRSHGIEFLNQDLTRASEFPPVWETAAKAGKRVGVFASLQSYPPPPDDAYAFYIPDTFAPQPGTIPPECRPFQMLNLRQTALDGGIVSDVKPSRELATLMLGLVRIGLSLSTVLALARQVILEKINPLYKSRRSIMQAPIAFDVFKHLLHRTKPEFTTFFTNHVAGMMHRYWKHAFPEEFQYTLTSDEDRLKAKNIQRAMDVADYQLGYLLDYITRTDGTLIVASSMGQEAVFRSGGDQARIIDVPAFVRAIGFSGDYRSNLAMHPDFNFEFDTPEDAGRFASLVEAATFAGGRRLCYKVNLVNRTLNFGLAQPPEGMDNYVERPSGGGVKEGISFAEAGIKRFKRDVGTGYHQPRGILLWHRPGEASDASREVIQSTAVRAMILSALGIAVEPKSPLPSDRNPTRNEAEQVDAS